MQKLRGPKGTTVHIEIKRRGYEQPIPLEVTRDEVYIPTVPAAFMIDATTGYIRLQDFGENTDRDVKRALRDLDVEGDEAAAARHPRQSRRPARSGHQGDRTSSCRAGEMIVYTRGRIPNSDQDYRATEDSEFTDIPMVVIANRNSASASEIVTGALQDHDRAYSSAKRRSARRSCSRCIASAAAPAWR